MSVFDNVINQIRIGDLVGAANGLIVVTQGTITYQQAMKEIKEVAEVFKKTHKPRSKQDGQNRRPKTTE